VAAPDYHFAPECRAWATPPPRLGWLIRGHSRPAGESRPLPRGPRSPRGCSSPWSRRTVPRPHRPVAGLGQAPPPSRPLPWRGDAILLAARHPSSGVGWPELHARKRALRPAVDCASRRAASPMHCGWPGPRSACDEASRRPGVPGQSTPGRPTGRRIVALGSAIALIQTEPADGPSAARVSRPIFDAPRLTAVAAGRLGLGRAGPAPWSAVCVSPGSSAPG